MIAKFFLFALLGTSLVMANHRKHAAESHEQTEILTVTVTACIAKDLYERIDQILKSYTHKCKAILGSPIRKSWNIEATIQRILKTIVGGLNKATENDKQNFGEILSKINKRKQYCLKCKKNTKGHTNVGANVDANVDADVGVKTNVDADVDVNAKVDADVGVKANVDADVNLDLLGLGIGVDLGVGLDLERGSRSLNSRARKTNIFAEVRRTVTEELDRVQKELVKIEGQTSKNAEKKIQIIKQKSMKLVDDAKTTSDQVKAEMVEAYKEIQEFTKVDAIPKEEVILGHLTGKKGVLDACVNVNANVLV